jgi:hypothetical protein
MKKARARAWFSMVERLMKICMGWDGRIGCLLDSVHIFRPMLCVCLGVQTFIFPWLGYYFSCTLLHFLACVCLLMKYQSISSLQTSRPVIRACEMTKTLFLCQNLVPKSISIPSSSVRYSRIRDYISHSNSKLPISPGNDHPANRCVHSTFPETQKHPTLLVLRILSNPSGTPETRISSSLFPRLESVLRMTCFIYCRRSLDKGVN